jgi:ATP-dependent Zn protease
LISPANTSAVVRGGNITFTFSANSGYYVSSVAVDGVDLPSADISTGTYTFKNVMMNHSIDVKSSSGTQKADISLNIDIDEKKGYAEYSLDGGKTFIKYTGTVKNISEGSDVVVRAYADDGYVFEKWETPTTITSWQASLGNAESSMNIAVVFDSSSQQSSDSSGGSILWWVLGLIILLIIIFFIILILWRRRKKDENAES